MTLTLGSLFSGIGGFELGFQNASNIFKLAWQIENDPFCISILEKHYPNTQKYTDIKEVDINELERPNIICAGMPCFVKGTLIDTKDGLKPIENLNAGDLVKTHNFCYKPIKNIITRESEVYKVKVSGTIPIRTTEEHPFLVRERTDRQPHRGPISHSFSETKWVFAKDLNKSHYIGFPLDNASDDIENWGSLDFWYLVGRWLGDGWIVDYQRSDRRDSKNGKRYSVVICTGKSDENSLESYIAKAGFHATKVRDRTATKFHINSKELVEFFTPFGRGAKHKTIPGYIFYAPLKIQESIFNGWVDADGYRTKDLTCGTSISKLLILSMARIARNVYRTYVSVRLAEVSPQKYIEDRLVNQNPFYQIRISKNPRKIFFIDDKNMMWCRVNSVINTKQIEQVYNISVEEDETYIAEGCVVHNCQPYSFAGRRNGSSDDRYLWPQTFNIIRGLKPDWFILENVRGLLTAEKGEIFGRILSDLASIGYDAEWEVLPARAFGAPHKRDRIFVVAYPIGKGLQRPFFEGGICSIEEQTSTEFGNRSIACGSWWLENISNIRMGDGISLRLARSRVKSYGNTVCPPVIEFLAKRILEIMERL